MKRSTALFLVLLSAATAVEARRVVVKSPRARVTVHRNFPIHRALPSVVVRPAPVVHVRPAVYVAPVTFTAVRVNAVPATRVWTGTTELESEDGWTDVTLNVDRRGDRLMLQIDEGAAQISFAEVVFDNGEAQVVDFGDEVRRNGVYALLDFKDGRKIDHVRVVARAAKDETEITLYLAS